MIRSLYIFLFVCCLLCILTSIYVKICIFHIKIYTLHKSTLFIYSKLYKVVQGHLVRLEQHVLFFFFFFCWLAAWELSHRGEPWRLNHFNTIPDSLCDNNMFFNFNTRELPVNRKDLGGSLKLSGTTLGEPSTRPPSCTTP